MPSKPVPPDTKIYELYLEERRVLIEAQRETAASFDKAILTLASGAFAVSVVFLKDVVPNPPLGTRWWLGWSWALFALSIITILVGFLSSQAACARQITLCELELLKDKRGSNYWARVAHVCNWMSIVMLAAAFLLSGRFVYLSYFT